MKTDVNGTSLYYEVTGSGSPLIMVHGNGEDHSIFYEAAEVLKEYFTVYLIDSRGHGQSAPVKEYHYQDMADDMAEFIKKLGLEDVTFYGFSDGGIIGLLLAAQTRLCKRYIVSGANTDPFGVKHAMNIKLRLWYLRHPEPLVKLMLREPHISKAQLAGIKDDVIVLAGEHDLIREAHTRRIHSCIPGSRLEIVKDRDHGSYIVNSAEIAALILKYAEN